MDITFDTIGTIHTPFTTLEDMPIQPVAGQDIKGEVVLEEKWQPGLKDLEGFSHIYLIYFWHQALRTELEVIPYLDTVVRGVFATRSPLRPVKIGLSVVRLLAVKGNRLEIADVDMLDGTPLLDIKPYVPAFDNRQNAKPGWLNANPDEIATKRSDKRFI